MRTKCRSFGRVPVRATTAARPDPPIRAEPHQLRSFISPARNPVTDHAGRNPLSRTGPTVHWWWRQGHRAIARRSGDPASAAYSRGHVSCSATGSWRAGSAVSHPHRAVTGRVTKSLGHAWQPCPAGSSVALASAEPGVVPAGRWWLGSVQDATARQQRQARLPAGRLCACCLPGLGWEVACCGEGSIVAAGAWNWPAGLMPAGRTGLGLLPGVSGAEVVAAAGVAEVTVRWWCGLPPPVGWGAAG